MRKIVSTLIGSSVAAGFLSLSATAGSAATVGGMCMYTDMSGFTSCTGAFSGNDAQGGGAVGEAQLNLDYPDYDWMFVDDVDAGSSGTGIFDVGTGNSGTLVVDSSVVGGTPFSIALKSSTYYSLYFFDDLGSLTTNNDGNYVIEWSTLGVAINDNNGKAKDLSHASLYTTPVPEPLTILGAGAAISFGTAFKRKLGQAKKNDKKG
ncbi:MAG: PEP-CTERM sorting domain-containing protein [Crocosphaera sp.]